MSAKRVTSQDVARRAGVSRTTVSFVLNNVEGMQISDETRKRVLTAARELGYVPDAAAQALASGRSKTIGLLLARRSRQISSDLFMMRAIEALVHVVNQAGMRLLLEVVEDYENRESYLKLVRSNSIDGVLYSGPRFDDGALDLLLQHNIPTVLMGTLPENECWSVDVNNRAAARLAVSHLAEMGHRRIACITNAPLTYSAARDRLMGYQDALDEAGAPFDPELVRHGDFNCDSGYLMMKNLLESGQRFSAVFVASDVVAFGALAAAREAGVSIPRDMALVGFDDVPMSQYVDPPLTTVHLPIAELASNAGEMLVQLVRGEAPPCKHLLLDAQLVRRQSCRYPSCS